MKKILIIIGMLLIMAALMPVSVWAQGDTYALDFDGDNDYVSMPHHTSIDLNTLTIEAWIKPDDLSNSPKVMGKTYAGSAQKGYALGLISDGELYGEVFSSWSGGDRFAFVSSAGDVPTGKWTHIAMTWTSGGNLCGYVNGIRVADVPTKSMDITTSDDFIIGMAPWYNLNQNHFDGIIDEVRIWNDVRTQTEIQEYMCEDISSESGLVAYYRMTDGSGTTLTDNSSNSNTGTLHNMDDSDWVTDYQVPAGNGTSGNEYQVQTLNHLYWLSHNSGEWSKWFEQTADIDMTVTQNWNDDHSGDAEGFSPIGTSSTQFTGSYDGDGYTIDNLYIDRSSTGYVGLFGETGGSSIIKNLGLINNDIYGNRYVGGIAGYNNGEIDNCYTTGPVKAYNRDVGGIAGINYGPVTHCHAEGDISASGDTDCQTAGGLVGDHRGTIDNCYATGNVSVSTSGNTTGFEVGGLVGYVYDSAGISVTNSYATGTVTGIEEVGGLIGDNKRTVSGCYSTGNVLCYPISSDYHRAEGGGFIGVNYGDVDNCYTFSNVVRKTDGRYNSYGGFVGRQDSGSIEKSYCANTVTASTGTAIDGLRAFSGYGMTENDATTGNFADQTVTNQTSVYGAVFKTTTEMKTQSTFTDAGWDFTDTWEMTEGVTYPLLQGLEGQPPIPEWPIIALFSAGVLALAAFVVHKKRRVLTVAA